jgi:hypothetical protein
MFIFGEYFGGGTMYFTGSGSDPVTGVSENGNKTSVSVEGRYNFDLPASKALDYSEWYF